MPMLTKLKARDMFSLLPWTKTELPMRHGIRRRAEIMDYFRSFRSNEWAAEKAAFFAFISAAFECVDL
ncbi:hypothetical protein D3C87_2077390 [compost metagenome]